MARIDNLTNFLTDVATAIKDKKGDNTSIKASDFDTEITNLPSGGGSAPTKGFIAEEYDSDGYVTKARVVGMTSLVEGAFSNYTSSGSFLTKNLQEVVLPSDMTSLGDYCFAYTPSLTILNIENITSIGKYCFYGNKALPITELPKNLTTIGEYAFALCKGIATKISIPDGVTKLEKRTFYNTPIRQISMENVTEFYDVDSTNSPFYTCTSLYCMWIGSAITDLSRYALVTRGATTDTQRLLKVYIDLPRATVTKFSGYNIYRFVNNNSSMYQPTIICNDDADFITKEEFDAKEF